MNPRSKNTLNILEQLLQKEIYIHSRYVHTEGVAKYNLGRQLEHLVRTRNKLEPHEHERLDKIIDMNRELKPKKKFEMKRNPVKLEYHPPTKQNTLVSRQRALNKAIADGLASENEEPHAYTCGFYFANGRKMFQCKRKTIGRKHCAYHDKWFAKNSAVHAMHASTETSP